mmetsp:Transcript_15359/g.33371  ORF Transcript_15359/g.33371 Transcript_15359/m.33371 type:complete len:96 (+) Transcript_15359:483-770(+)
MQASHAFSHALWIPQSKMALFVYNCPEGDLDIVKKVAALKPEERAEVSALQWVSLPSLQDPSFCRDRLHPFARQIVNLLNEFDVISELCRGTREE